MLLYQVNKPNRLVHSLYQEKTNFRLELKRNFKVPEIQNLKKKKKISKSKNPKKFSFKKKVFFSSLKNFFLVTSLPPAVNWVRPYWNNRDIHDIETLTLCYCLRMLGKWVGFLDIEVIPH
ncbi:hypothetical protein BpHYR1_029266 [Brachionus plicatilis]|uniref:Uncharacterized protein n=1 Tax=Brachionus plicatilis TaxID=10195 RepID=A0A3M7Q059_BRAPC|nr:hypothetical protein BpHYR1_029266 [Brachionus plicatilis]